MKKLSGMDGVKRGRRELRRRLRELVTAVSITRQVQEKFKLRLCLDPRKLMREHSYPDRCSKSYLQCHCCNDMTPYGVLLIHPIW